MTAVMSKGTAVVTLPTDTQILITREFNAPRDLIYKACTTPELVKRWWSARRGTVTVAEIDLAQDPQVLGDLRLGQPEQLDEIVDRPLALGEEVEDLPPPGFGHRVELPCDQDLGVGREGHVRRVASRRRHCSAPVP